jgi:hypothetical protein
VAFDVVGDFWFCLSGGFCFCRHPITQVQVFLYFSSFVPMLPRLLRLVIHFAEGVFGIANGFTNDFQRFGHSLCVYVSMVASVEEIAGLALVRPSTLDWHELLQAVQAYDRFEKRSI